MASFEVAHIREQGVDLIIIPVSPSFGGKSPNEQSQLTTELQIRARSAGLAGTIVPVWLSAGRFMSFVPNGFRPFFSSIDMDFVAANINKRLSW